MDERQTLYDMAHRRRKNCRICGDEIGHEEAFYTDGYTTVHMSCFFDYQCQEVS
jgi:hypothetical protein